MTAVVTAAVIGTTLLAVAIWVDVRERRPAVGDGTYRSSGNSESLKQEAHG